MRKLDHYFKRICWIIMGYI